MCSAALRAGVVFTVAILVPSFPVAALEWEVREAHRFSRVRVGGGGRPGFSAIAPDLTGIAFTNLLALERSLTNQIFLNGSGVAAGDIDGDGWTDLYICGLDVPNALYRNLRGWRFENVAAATGVECGDQASTGAAFADVDGDGDLDLLVNGIARGTRLFLNDGRGRFQEGTVAAGLRGTSGAASLALADVDGNGHLDLYVVNYRSDTIRDMPDIRFRVGVTNGVSRLLSVNGRPATAPDLAGRFSFDQQGGVLENGEADALFRNEGSGRFTRVNWTNGAFLGESGAPVATPYDWGLSAMFRDLNGDGAPDLYVCNDFQSPDRIWINDGRGNFRAIGRAAIGQTSLFSMGVDFADIDRDGHDDVFVADMLSPDHLRRQVQVMEATAFAQARATSGERPQFPHNTLLRNRGNGSFAEIGQLAGVDASDWSWCPVFLDVDLDGYEDLLITTGHWRDAMNADVARELDDERRRRPMSPLEQLRARRRFPRLDTPNVAFRNRGDLTFEASGVTWGFDSRRISHGMALADLDNDGDLDVVINCLNDAPLLLRNEAPAPRLAVRLRGDAPNTRGIGAKILVRAPGLPVQSQEMTCGGRYLSSDDFLRAFAAGRGTNHLTVEVLWRSGRRSVVKDVPVNCIVEVDERAASPTAGAGIAVSAAREDRTDSGVRGSLPLGPRPYFADASDLLNHRHTDAAFDDFARQPLLPRTLGGLGPGLTWFDFNGDGWDDLFIGAGRGGRVSVFRNDQKGGFVPQRAGALGDTAGCDATTLLAWRPAPGMATLLIGQAHYESGRTDAPAVRQFSMNTGVTDDSLLRSSSSTGPMAMADIDGDGDLDLFVGGRVIAGRYPEAASSALLRNDAGRLQADAEWSASLGGAGLVSGAVFTDLNADGWPDLVLACDWGAIRVFRNERGRLVAWDVPLRMGQSDAGGAGAMTLRVLTGWWNSVAAGDFDNDGRLDLMVGNWGRNHTSRRSLDAPLRLYFGDADGSGNHALLLTAVDPGLQKRVPVRDWSMLSGSFPVLRERFAGFAAFAQAGAAEVLAAGLPPMQAVEAAQLDSMVFLNRGDHFDAKSLPVEAQFAPVFGTVVGDFNGDGNEDLFLAQNFFDMAPPENRQDAGCGLWLRGDGKGGFAAAPTIEAGFSVSGEGRGAAACDFDRDGRLDLAVSQNGGATKLYRNTRGRPGFRVLLTGSPLNPQAIGAAVRCIFRDGRLGPAREIHVGGGYWSQDSAAILFGAPDPPEAIEIRWPGGTLERVPVSPGSTSIERTQPVNSGSK